MSCDRAEKLGRPGSDLLSHALRRSTISAEGFHGRVRNGIGCRPLAMTTRSSKLPCTFAETTADSGRNMASGHTVWLADEIMDLGFAGLLSHS